MRFVELSHCAGLQALVLWPLLIFLFLPAGEHADFLTSLVEFAPDLI